MSGRVMTEHCEACGRTGKRYAGNGLCAGCYTRRRRLNPDHLARDREWSRRWKDQNRERNRERDRLRAADPSRRGQCDVCGGLMGVGVLVDGTCQECVTEAHERRWQRIEAWWAEGRSVLWIADALGVKQGTFAGEMDTMRRAGRALPYRYRNTKLQQVAA